MVRTPCCDKEAVKKGTWSAEEDATLTSYIDSHGAITNWIALPQKIGLNRCGKSCRLRWLNYLRPHIKHGEFTEEEDKIITQIYFSIGSRWSVMADSLPGRTDNDIKNYWNTKLKKKIVGNQKKAHKKPSSRSLHGGMSVDSSPPVFTITNGHLLSSSWPSNTEIHNQQDQFDGCKPDGGSPPIILSFSSGNTTSTCSSGEGGASTSSTPHDPPKRKTIEDYQSIPGQFCFPNTISSGGGAEASPTIPGPPMNNIIKDRQSTICQFCFCENKSSSSSYDSLNKLHRAPNFDMDTYMNMDMNTYINVDGGSTSTPLEDPSTSLKELQNLLFDGSPTNNTATTNPFRVNVIKDPNDFFQNHFENQGSWDEDATISSLISSLPMEDYNNNVDPLSNSYDCEGNFLPWNASDQFT